MRRSIAKQGRRSASTLVAVAIVVSFLSLTGGKATTGSANRAAVVTETARPNVLIIMTDDHRTAGTMAVLPHVRRWFGTEGRRFAHAFASTPLCCPSRATALTGRYAHNHGIVDNSAKGRRVFDERTTLERYLQEVGYRTAFFGKFFNFWKVEDDPSFFDRWAIVSPSRTSNGYTGGTWNVQGTLRTIDRYSTDFIAAQGARFIEANEGDDAEPWFLELSTYAPHLTAVPAPAYADAPVGRFRPTPAMTEANRSDKPRFVRKEDASLRGTRTARERQLRTLMSVDDLVAQLSETLRRTGESRNTLAFFLSDNGFLWGEHGLRSKGYPYGPGVRIPFFMRWPGQVEAATVDQRFTAIVDVTPTILDAAGIEPDPALPIDGRSLLDDGWSRDHMLLESWPWSGTDAPAWASLWGRGFQYTEYYAADGAVTFREYYDLRADPWQLRNLLHDGDRSNDPDLEPLHHRLRLDRTCVGTACP